MNFDERAQKYLEGAQQIINEEYQSHYNILRRPILTFVKGKRYLKVVETRQDVPGESVFAFIDKNGDILRPASWSRPAKHARGNIFDDDFGLSQTEWTGPKYLR
ncbi:MAG: hypothetical protein DWQ19_12930 [Crenarchaeota archaeon]|nr:MAG: hypothetical protein DWQ19_12930 [Thermoproteota archaeon]